MLPRWRRFASAGLSSLIRIILWISATARRRRAAFTRPSCAGGSDWRRDTYRSRSG